MAEQRGAGLKAVLVWLVFPVVPVLLARFYAESVNPSRTDPRQWDFAQFVILLGPLGGYAYLAGATAGLPDDPTRKGWRTWLSRRALWVAAGPWLGLLAVMAYGLFQQALDWLTARLLSHRQIEEIKGGLAFGPWSIWALLALLAYGWLIVALAAGWRARKRKRLLRSLGSGLAVAVGFLGSLLGGFWAVTSSFRSFFFDPRMAKVVLIAALGLGVMAGCGPPPTVGDMRRRELFQAMTAAWVLGLALVWRWVSRPRRK